MILEALTLKEQRNQPYLLLARQSGVSCVDISQDSPPLHLLSLLPVDVIQVWLPAAEQQGHVPSSEP